VAFLTLLLALSFGFVFPVVAAPVPLTGTAGSAPVAATRPNGYLLGPGDKIEISIYQDPDYRHTFQIGGSGTVTLPLVGPVRVAGRTIEQVREEVRGALRNGYYRDPTVIVNVLEYRSRKAAVLGAVRKPSVVTLFGPTDVLSLLAQAGGLSGRASGRLILVRRGAGAATGVTILDGRALLTAGDLSQNRPIYPGDTLFAARAGEVYIVGEVQKPGSYPYQDGLTVVRALTLAGGLKPTAKEGSIQVIRRRADGSRRRIYVDFDRVLERKDPDPALVPDDVILVPESFF